MRLFGGFKEGKANKDSPPPVGSVECSRATAQTKTKELHMGVANSVEKKIKDGAVIVDVRPLTSSKMVIIPSSAINIPVNEYGRERPPK
jgi:hypothetical protein